MRLGVILGARMQEYFSMSAGLEAAAFKLGVSVANAAVRAIASTQERRKLTSKDLDELARQRFSPLNRMTANRRIEDMGDKIARRLEPLYLNEFVDVTKEEKGFVFTFAAEIFEAADLSDEVLFRVDLSAKELAEVIQEQAAQRIAVSSLQSRERELLRRALLESSQCLIQTVLILKPFASRAILEGLVRQTRLEERLDDLLSRVPRPIFGTRSGPEADRFLQGYLLAIVPQLDHLDIFGIDVASRLRLKLSLGYIGLTVETEHVPSDPFRFGGFSDGSDVARKVAVSEAFGKGSRFLLRGEAGSGKSTLMRWLAVSAALREFTGELQNWNSLTPFLIKLRSYADRPLPSIEELVRDIAPGLRDAAPENWVYRTFSAGNGLLLIDGLDELDDNKRYDVRAWLVSLVATFPNISVVVTSRPAAADPRWLAELGFTSLVIDPLSPSDCRTFVRRWHDAAQAADHLPCDVAELPAYESSLLRELDSKQHLRALASSPLLAAMICALNLDRDGQLPEDRKDLYESALDLLLERRDRKRSIKANDARLAKSAKLVLLRSIALNFSINGHTELAKDAVLADITRTLRVIPGVEVEPRDVLEYLVHRSGIVREPAVGRIDFIHKTFQEFLTAQAVAELDYVGVLIENAHQDRWREIILMFPAQATETQRKSLIRGLFSRAEVASLDIEKRQLSLLAAVCVQHTVVRSDEFQHQADELLAAVIPPQDASSAALLATMGQPILELLPKGLDALPDSAALACVRTAAMIAGDRAMQILQGYSIDSRPSIQQALIDSWDYFVPERFAETVLKNAPLDAGSVTLGTTRPIRHLAQLVNIRRLRIDLARLVRDRDPRVADDLSHLRNVTQLAQLDLDTRGLSDLSFLEGLVYVRDLSLWGASGLTSGAALKGMAALRRLLLSDSALAGGISDLESVLRQLSILGVTNPSHTVDIACLGDAAQLSVLQLRKCRIENWESVARIATLNSLRLERCECVGGIDLVVLAGLDSLEILGLYGATALVSGYESLVSMPSLRKVETDWSIPIDVARALESSGVELTITTARTV